MFPPDLLDDMIAGFLNDPDSADIWLTYDDSTNDDELPLSVVYCAPEAMANGTSNLYLIAVRPDRQGDGIGTLMMQYLESLLAKKGQRILLVETSGATEFAKTRQFYRNNGYDQEARIRDFYDKGDDKIIFWKSLAH